MSKFGMKLTNAGIAKVINATMSGQKLDIVQFAVGDANGTAYEPTQDMTALKNLKWRGPVASVEIEKDNPFWIVVTCPIPAEHGGFWIREAGLYDAAGDLVAIGKTPDSYKPILAEGASKDFVIEPIIEVSNAAAVTLKIDPNVIQASRKYVQEQINPIEQQLDNLNRQKATKEEVQTLANTKVNKIEGKQLSTNDYTTVEKKLVNQIPQIADELQTKASLADVGNIAKAEPLFAKDISFMTDTTRLYVNLSDGYIYTHSNGEWVTTNRLYQATGLDKNSVTQEHLSMNVVSGIKSKNLFDKHKLIPNSYIETNGTLAIAEGWYASDYIAIEPGVVHHKNLTNTHAFYDVNKSFISSEVGRIINVPSNAHYIKISIPPGADANKVQVEKGKVETSYENYETKIGKESIGFPIPSMQEPKNLFNKNNVTRNAYILYTTGAIENLSNGLYCASEFIKIKPSTVYTKNNDQQLAFYDNDGIYISGIAKTRTFTTPDNATYVRVTVETDLLNVMQLEEGAEATPYENFAVAKVDYESLPRELYGYENIVIVDKGNRQFDTITKAIDSIKDDSKDKQYVIIVLPGVYVESVKLFGRYISLVGVDKDLCVVKTFSNDYYHPPLDISSPSNVSNITFIADVNASTPPEGVNNMPAYALHYDISGRFDHTKTKFHGTCRIKNCVFKAKYQHAAGVGLTINQHLVFEDCEFVSDVIPFRAHNHIDGGSTNQKMTVKNCTFYRPAGIKVLQLQDPNHQSGAKDNYDTVFTFINNVAWTDEDGQGDVLIQNPAPLEDGCIAGYIKLGKGSFGNSLATLNFK